MSEGGEGVEYICKGGEGSEADIFVELRSVFPGIGGTVRTFQAIAVAYRKEYSVLPGIGDRMFLRQALIKKLEDYFFRKGRYRYAHITRPLGSLKEGYVYEWAFGTDVFPWYYTDKGGNLIEVTLEDWKEFISAFNEAGIDLHQDCTDPENGNVSQNIIHQFPRGANALNPRLNRLWKRIDFGQRSIRINFSKLMDYLVENEQDIRSHLAIGRYDLLVLICRYLTEGSKMDPLDLGKLEILVREYRYSTLSHLNTRGVDGAVEIKIE